MMLGQVFEASLTEEPKPTWRKSPSMSSSTTADEDSPVGSPKQRWADLSEEDDDLFSPERSPFGCFTYEGKHGARDGTEKCADSNIPHGVNNDAHEKWGEITKNVAPKFFNKQQQEFVNSDTRLDFGRIDERKQPHSGSVSNRPFGMPPPSVKGCMTNTQTAIMPHICPADTTYSNSKTAADIFTVTLSGIPINLCNEVGLDAILWAAGVQRSSLGYHTKRNGHITINFDTLDAATHCFNHFKACSWTTGKLNVHLVLPGSNRTKDGNWGNTHDSKSFSGFSQMSRRQPKFAQQMW